MENLTGGTPPVRYLPCVVPCKLYFSTVKNSFDLSMVAISALLCIINHSAFYGIGVGTVLSALMLGRIIKLYEVLWRVKA